MWPSVETAVGVGYVVCTLLGGVWYLRLLTPSFANDLWWPGYNLSWHQAFLVDVVNQLLQSQANGTFDVLSPIAVVAKRYDAGANHASFYLPYIHEQLLTPQTSFRCVVQELRALSAYWAFRMNVQYCWVDLNKTFEVAHTVARQGRCADLYSTNAAVYLETMLRNQDWPAMQATWGGDGIRFNVAIERGLQETSHGRRLLSDMAAAKATTSVDDEVAYWHTYDVAHYTLQWQNRWGAGIAETLVLQNAFGMTQQITLKALDQITGPWSSQTMFWIPIQDLFSAMVMNRSFVRGTSRFFGANTSGLPTLSLESYRGINVGYGVAHRFHDSIGPFLSVDCLYVPPPVVLREAYNHFLSLLHTELQASGLLRAAFYAGTAPVVAPVPASWRNRSAYFGGDPMCTSGTATAFVQQSFDFYDACTSAVPLTLSPSPSALLWAALAANATVSPTWLQSAVPTMAMPSDLADMVVAIPLAVAMLNVSLMQYAASTSRVNEMDLLLHPLLGDPTIDPNWHAAGWCFLFEWALGQREVVAFAGDVSTLVLLSNAYPTQAYIASDAILQSATQLVLTMVGISSMMLLVAGAAALVGVSLANGRIVGRNLLYLNRVVGAIWMGRPLALIRGMSAILLLATAQLHLVTEATPATTRLEASPRSIFETSLLAGEATWVSYVLTDVAVVVAREAAPLAGALGACSSWLFTLLWTLLVPVAMEIRLDRRCSPDDMDYGLVCTSGVLRVGSYDRTLLLLGAQVIFLAMALVLTVAWRRPSLDVHRTVRLVGMADVLMCPLAMTTRFDLPTCLLCGLVPLSSQRVFDVTLWGLYDNRFSVSRRVGLHPNVRRDATMAMHGPTLHRTWSSVFASVKKRSRRFMTLVALGNMVVAVVSSVSYFEVSQVNLANDYYWANFNVTGAHAFFATWLNEQLVLGLQSASPLLEEPSVLQEALFAADTAYVLAPNNYGALLQHAELHTIEDAITGLRASDACMAPWIFSPYCFLDFDRAFEVAYSAARQARCYADMPTNGAVYLESLLRNIDYRDWTNCWGTAFETAYARDLRGSVAGQKWLDMVSANPVPLSTEAAYWRQHGVESYDTQWQNYKRIGVMNSYSITNAYGVSNDLTLMALNGTYRVDRQTTYKMYWSLANDLSAILRNTSGIGGRSLLRRSSQFAFLNTTLQAVLMANGTLTSPLQNGLQVVSQLLGPFGTVDMIYISVPPLVLRFVADAIERLRHALGHANTGAQAAYFGISPVAISYPIPSVWLEPNVPAYGSSPLCPELSAPKRVSTGLANIIGFDLACIDSSPMQSKVVPTRMMYVVASLLSSLAFLDIRSINTSAICRFDVANAGICPTYLVATMRFVKAYLLSVVPLNETSALVTEARRVHLHVVGMNVSLMVYAKPTNNVLRLLQAPVLPDDAFAFFGWTYLFDWVLGHREVISFRGDANASLTLLTDATLPLRQQVPAWQVTGDFAQYSRACVYYVTCVMLGVAVVATGYMLTTRGHFEGQNLLKLDRIGGIVWVGRPVLILRSLTALCLLSTASLDLGTSGFVSFFDRTPLPFYKMLLASWEVAWLVVVVDDIGLVVTREHAHWYLSLHSIVVCCGAVLYSYVMPVAPSLVVEKQCQVVEMDFQILCTSADLVIGHVRRLLGIVVCTIVSHLLGYILARLVIGPLPPTKVTSRLLSAGAKYLYNHSRCVVHGVFYLDRASAALNGVLTYRHQNVLYAFDIKLWRILAAPVPDDGDLRDALPLPDGIVGNEPWTMV
ncbi:hypothetical protein SDRG_04478 [Saprolegnia diclina VS20]|uniref:Uncharacterized protein n=1 Tax=Saprolegnia diclina (strain VS20) TaxID=1156394 RepID=T0RZU1_SAPDV|nr:hypothetical protein SDRG_04478 [Saprolegnia diclina VS20]EQC38048.1 hypothetical protein SDRG_04478 [Saprolegnia diclina VS20]|eukprot:XP_008608375.1 hypothetical protein SDRG_04478 [Saprolegnia diclina VS20]